MFKIAVFRLKPIAHLEREVIGKNFLVFLLVVHIDTLVLLTEPAYKFIFPVFCPGT